MADPVGTTPDPQAADYERDSLKAEAQRLKAELEQVKGTVPTEAQRKRWEALEAEAAKSEEQRRKKAGEFDAWRDEITRQVDTEKAQLTEAKTAAERELHATLIGLEFAGASALFGGAEARTLLTPEVAQAYLAKYVTIERTDAGARQVVVHDLQGRPIVDVKTGAPMAFGPAMEAVIESLPNREKLLKGSGKAGSGSPGGTSTAPSGPIDWSRMTSHDFADPKVRAAWKAKAAKAGGLQIGTAWDKADQS